MPLSNRKTILENADTVVIKVGTNVLTDHTGALCDRSICSLTDQIAWLRAQNRRVVLVSSGAVGAGMGRLGLTQRPSDLRHLQACAAVGQTYLMRAYEAYFTLHGIPTAQILLTASDFDHRARYLNVRNTLLSLFEWDCLPIINENDTVSTDEIRFGDNDQLGAQVTNLLQAPLLILLSVVNGLYTDDPFTNPQAKPVPVVEEIDEKILGLASSAKSGLGLGGMESKLKAARLATGAGEAVILTSGKEPQVLQRLFEGEELGTLFTPGDISLPAWKRWIGYTARPRGRIVIDIGARQALIHQGRSLLPIGIAQVKGGFQKGDVVALDDPEGVELGRGLTNYSSEELQGIRGLRSREITMKLGELPYEEVIHRDNLVIVLE